MDAITNTSVKNPALYSNQPIRLQNAGLYEAPNGEIMAQGWIDVAAIGQLRIGDYQREVLNMGTAKKSGIRRAVEEGVTLPAIMVGMRGQNFESRGHTITLLDECYIIDGLQRISAMQYVAEAKPELAKALLIGVEVKFDTTSQIERDLFVTINTSRVPISPNVILRNLREGNDAIFSIYELCHNEPKFALYKAVCWNQRMARSDLTTALGVCRVMRSLHARVGLFGGGSDRAQQLAGALDKLSKKLGLHNMRRNLLDFFDVVDQCFGIRTVEYKGINPQLKVNFLVTLARLFADHHDFWKGERLFVDSNARRKLSTFKIDDPQVIKLAGAGNMAMPLLFNLLVEHMNYRVKKANLLQRRLERDDEE